VELREALKKHFGFQDFIGQQEAAVEAALAGRNSLVLMPTGGGKSLCYQLPALLLQKPVLVISPLIALMKDQVDALRAKGIQAQFINSTLNRQDRETRLKQFLSGQLRLLYVTPERFRRPEFLEQIRGFQPGLLAVDEAHCISQWGHDFRPEYSRVDQLAELLGWPPIMALTATATPEVEAEICKKLKVESPQVLRSPLTRPNLGVRVEDLYGAENKIARLAEILLGGGVSIVYFSLISTLQEISRELEKRKIRHGVYHGQMQDRERRRSQEDFLQDRVAIMLATPAFGLGVDKPNVRQVVHFELPGSIEAYFQEIGRAGRDGLPARATLLYDEDDIATQMDFIKWANPDLAFIERVFRLVERNPDRVKSEGEDFLRSELNFYNRRDFRVETALNLLRSHDFLDGWSVLREFAADEWEVLGRELRIKKQHQKLLDLVQWAKKEDCRARGLYNYFAAGDYPDCGVCDWCEARS
jgi:ATP-dependent DNA helicase RecQ